LQNVKNLHKFLHFDDSAHSGEPSPFYEHKVFVDDNSLDGSKSESSLSPSYLEITREADYREKHNIIGE